MLITNPVGVLSLSKREILRFISLANQTVFPPIVSSTLFMYIFGVALGSRIDFGLSGITYLGFIVPGLMTMHLISSSYENTSSSLFIARWHNHIQEVLLSPLSYFEMVLGLLAGGVARGVVVLLGVYVSSLIFTPIPIAHPFILTYFILMIAMIFSCAGTLGALWAEDFGMLSIWNIYLIIPLVLLGGVFHPIAMLPEPVRILSQFNPMFYLVQGIRFSVTGMIQTSLVSCILVALIMALFSFYMAVYLFKIGYKLRV